MSKDNYKDLSKEELIEKIEKIESRKKYGLIWDEEKTKEKFEKDAENALPVLKEVKGKEIKTDNESPTNILIEGDNYHSLSVLNFTHQEQVDVIYADPPYNTGNKSWKYNNDYVDSEDSFRHSKWLSFMSKRLKLSKKLLKEDGIIVITIDDYEIGTLRLLMDEIFGEQNRLGLITIVHNPRGRSDDKFFATSHEYALFYAKNAEKVKTNKLPLTEEQLENFNLKDEISNYRLLPLKRTGSNSTPNERPNLFYPIYYNKKTERISIDEQKSKDWTTIFPYDSNNEKRVWRWGKETLMERSETEIVVKKNGNGYNIFAKDRVKEGRKPKTVWVESKYDASSHGTMLLKKMFKDSNIFNYPKSIWAVIDTLYITCFENKEAVILDFMAGSGTTGHAVLELNKKDNGKRKFILCTNNELNGLEKKLRESGLKEKEIQSYGICQSVTHPRIKKAIEGYIDSKGAKIKGLGGNLKYYKTAFVKNSISRDEMKIKITEQCTEMLCLREGIFEEIKSLKGYKIFKQNDKIMAVYYSLEKDKLDSLKKSLDKIGGEKILYCFTLDYLGLDKSDFVGWDNVVLEPIPQKILDVYKDIYEY